MREQRKVLTGQVVSDKMEKTVVVLVKRQHRHRIYGKVITTSKKYKAHDEDNASHAGDIVQIRECRPMSRDKHWVVMDVVNRAE